MNGALERSAPGLPSVVPSSPRAAAKRDRIKKRTSRLVLAAITLFTITVPIDMVPVIGDRFGVSRIAGMLVLLVAILQPANALRRPHPALWWFTAYAAIVFLTGIPLYEAYGSEILQRVFTIAQLLLLFWVLSNVLQDDTVSRRTLLVFALSCALVAALMGLGIFRTSFETARGTRLSFAGGNSNQVGGTLMLGLLTLVGLAYTAHLTGRLWKWLVPMIAIPVAFAIMETGSRGSVVGLVGGLTAFVLAGQKLGTRMRNLVIFAMAAGVVYFAVYSTMISRSRWEEAVETRRLTGRERIYPAAIAMFMQKPIQGWGPEANRRELGMRVPLLGARSLDTHNMYLHVLTEVGVLGAIPFFIGLGLCLRSALRARSTPHGLLPIVLTSAVLIATLASNWALRKPLWLVLSYAAASGAGATQKRRRRSTLPYAIPVQALKGSVPAAEAEPSSAPASV